MRELRLTRVPPLCEHGTEPTLAEADQLAAAAAEAVALNAARITADSARGAYAVGERQFVQRLADTMDERLHREAHWVCDHANAICVVRVWAGATIAVACRRPSCAQAWQRHQLHEAKLLGKHCALCTDRSPWLDSMLITTTIAPGALVTPVHLSCTPPGVVETLRASAPSGMAWAP